MIVRDRYVDLADGHLERGSYIRADIDVHLACASMGPGCVVIAGRSLYADRLERLGEDMVLRVNGDLALGVRELPVGWAISVTGTVTLDELREVPRRAVIRASRIECGSAREIGAGATLVADCHIELDRVERIGDDCIIWAGRRLSMARLRELPLRSTISATGEFRMPSIVRAAGPILADVADCIHLGSLTELPAGSRLTAERDIWLDAVTSAPGQSTIEAGGDVHLGSMRELPPGLTVRCDGELVLAR